MRLKITVLPGDGIGPEVTRVAVRVLREVADLYEQEVAFEERSIGGAAIERFGAPLPEETLAAALAGDAVLLVIGRVLTPWNRQASGNKA